MSINSNRRKIKGKVSMKKALNVENKQDKVEEKSSGKGLEDVFGDEVKVKKRKPKQKLQNLIKKDAPSLIDEGVHEAIIVDAKYLKNQRSKYGITNILVLTFGVIFADKKWKLDLRLYEGGVNSKYHDYVTRILTDDELEEMTLQSFIGKQMLITIENNETERRTYQNIIDIKREEV